MCVCVYFSHVKFNDSSVIVNLITLLPALLRMRTGNWRTCLCSDVRTYAHCHVQKIQKFPGNNSRRSLSPRQVKVSHNTPPSTVSIMRERVRAVQTRVAGQDKTCSSSEEPTSSSSGEGSPQVLKGSGLVGGKAKKTKKVSLPSPISRSF